MNPVKKKQQIQQLALAAFKAGQPFDSQSYSNLTPEPCIATWVRELKREGFASFEEETIETAWGSYTRFIPS